MAPVLQKTIFLVFFLNLKKCFPNCKSKDLEGPDQTPVNHSTKFTPDLSPVVVVKSGRETVLLP